MASTTYQVTIGERTVRVQVRREATSTFVRVDDGPEQPADLRTLHGSVYALSHADEQVELAADLDGPSDAVRLVMLGLEYTAEVVDEARARLAAVAGGRGPGHAHVELKAPMPGLLVRVLCQPGDEVHAGQPLAVLQAMKMENELALPRGGKVSKVNVEAGQTVEQNQVLVVLE